MNAEASESSATPEARRSLLRPYWILTAALVVALVVLMGGLLSRRTEHRLDMTSGRVKRADFVFGFQVGSQDVETEFSRFAPPAAHASASSWKTYSSRWEAKWLWGFDNRGSHIAGSARADLKAFAILCDIHDVSKEEATVIAAHLVDLLQAGDADAISERVKTFQKHLESGIRTKLESSD